MLVKYTILLASDYSGPTPPYWGAGVTVETDELSDGALETLASAFADAVGAAAGPGSGNWSWTLVSIPQPERAIMP
jgi:hypothetical protein